MAIISLNGMEFYAFHGCFEEEQVIGNRYIVDVSIDYNSSQAEKTDNLFHTINYVEVYNVIKTEMDKKSRLVEHLTSRILNSISESFQEIKTITVTVHKLNPPTSGKTESISVTLSQNN